MERRNQVLCYLSGLPRKMLQVHGRDNMTEFVLHELCHEHCFNLAKAAYFVDNPDFDCLKGVAGHCRAEAFCKNNDIWCNPKDFTAHMQGSPFNSKVRTITQQSCRKKGMSDEEIVQNIAHELGMEHPHYSSWDMKHDNHGLFVYEKECNDQDCSTDDLLNGISLLSFCPVF